MKVKLKYINARTLNVYILTILKRCTPPHKTFLSWKRGAIYTEKKHFFGNFQLKFFN